MITGVHHVSVKYENLEMFNEALHFYCDILGLKVKLRWGEGEKTACMLQAGEDVIELFATGRVAGTTGAVNHLAFATSEVDEYIEKVRAAGYKINIEPKDVVLGYEGEMPARVAFCVGPGGEEIEFFWEK